MRFKFLFNTVVLRRKNGVHVTEKSGLPDIDITWYVSFNEYHGTIDLFLCPFVIPNEYLINEKGEFFFATLKVVNEDGAVVNNATLNFKESIIDAARRKDKLEITGISEWNFSKSLYIDGCYSDEDKEIIRFLRRKDGVIRSTDKELRKEMKRYPNDPNRYTEEEIQYYRNLPR